VTWIRVFGSRLRAFLFARRLDRDLEEELHTHVEMETAANLARGMEPDEARRAALREFGGLQQVKKTYRERRGLPFVESLAADVRYALRLLRKSPAFTTVAVLSLALGIGANAAIFTLIDQLLLRLLPVRHPEELVYLSSPGPKPGMDLGPEAFSYPLYCDLRDHNMVFSGMLGRYAIPLSLSWNGQSENVSAYLVSGNYFEVLGIRPFLGRLLTPDDDRHLGAHPVAVLSYEYWQRRFGGNPSIVGRPVTLTLTPMTIVGITPPGFHGLEVGGAVDVTVPLMMKPQMVPSFRELSGRQQSWMRIYARLKPGISRRQATAAINLLYHRILLDEVKDVHGSANFRKEFAGRSLELHPGGKGFSELGSQFTGFLIVLNGMVALVLLIATINLANVLTARAAARQREFAIRLAVGAGRARVVRQLVTESLLLSLAGGALGLVVSLFGASALLRLIPSQDIVRVLSPNPDARIFVFTLAVALLVGVLFGLIPALQATRPDLALALKVETGTSTRRTHLRKVLVICQMAFSLALLVGAGLFTRTLHNLKVVDTGIRMDHLLTFAVDPSLNGYTGGRAISLFQQIETNLARVPGVQSVFLSSFGPLNSASPMTMLVEGNPFHDEDVNFPTDWISSSTLAAAGVRLLSGREFTDADALSAPKVGIINQAMARRCFPNQNPIGKHVGFKYVPPNKADIEIVGVAKDVRALNLRDEMAPFLYVPYRQFPYLTQVTYHVRTPLPVGAAIDAIRTEIHKVDAHLAVFDVRTMENRLDESLFVEHAISLLALCFGLLATLLAAIGLYGIVSYNVLQRTREIGIRMALGAERRHVFSMVLREVVAMTLAGIAVGLPLALALMRLTRSVLYGISPADPLVTSGAVLLLALVAALASGLPARRAIRIDPLRALRYE
jgi:putative ABC transport system permease protein